MDWKIELVFLPVTDVDRAKASYVDQLGWHADHDQRVSYSLRFVQVRPSGSACSIAFGEGISPIEPGTQKGVQVVVPDADAAGAHPVGRRVECTEVDELAWGRPVSFADPDGNAWTLQQLPARG